MRKEETPINIQTELTRMYSQYGWSEMFLYKAQLLFESELDKKTNAKVLEALGVVKTLTDNNVSVTSEHIDNLIRNKTFKPKQR